jgi:hypothetical protein
MLSGVVGLRRPCNGRKRENVVDFTSKLGVEAAQGKSANYPKSEFSSVPSKVEVRFISGKKPSCFLRCVSTYSFKNLLGFISKEPSMETYHKIIFILEQEYHHYFNQTWAQSLERVPVCALL